MTFLVHLEEVIGKVYIYDNTLEGLLSSIYDAYYEAKPDRIYSEKVYNAIVNKTYYVYLSEIKESSNIIYYYLLMGFKYGKDVELYKNNDIVINLDKISQKVSYEKHRFTGLVRFKEVNNVLFATISPDNNILPLIGNHFKNRLTNEYFIVFDSKREKALVYDKNNFQITDLTEKQKEI